MQRREGRLRFATNSSMYNGVTQTQQHVQHRIDNGRKLCCVAEFQAETGDHQTGVMIGRFGKELRVTPHQSVPPL